MELDRDKKEEKTLAQKRNEFRTKYENEDFKILKSIGSMAIKAKDKPEEKFQDLMKVLTNEGLLYQAMGNISKRKGATTKGPIVDERTADKANKQLITDLATKWKDGTFRLKPMRRIYMDKTGKEPITKEQFDQILKLHQQGRATLKEMKELKARPLGIWFFPDKIVQEAIRIILNVIYEPKFARIDYNFGFRAKYGCQDAIMKIQNKACLQCKINSKKTII